MYESSDETHAEDLDLDDPDDLSDPDCTRTDDLDDVDGSHLSLGLA